MLDVRYARTIKNIQRVLVNGLLRMARIHLTFLGKDPFAGNVRIKFAYISTIEEAEKMEALSSKVDSISKLTDLISSIDKDGKIIDTKEFLKYILSNYLSISGKEAAKFFKVQNTQEADTNYNVTDGSFNNDLIGG